jgi:hypothetical protein
MHEDPHLRFGLGLDESQRQAFLADCDGVSRGELADLLDGEDEGGGDGRGPVRGLDYDEGEVLGGVVDEAEEGVGAGQLERLLLDVELLLDLVAH